MTLNYKQRRLLALASFVIGITLVIVGMLITGSEDLPYWLQGIIILCGFFISSFGTKLLRCNKCHKFVEWQTGQCTNCKN